MSHTKQSEELNKLLGQVISVRRATPVEYDLKLKKFLIQRASQMQNGIFDGVKLPEVKRRVHNSLHENLQQNRELTQQAQVNAEKYLYAKSAHKQLSKELGDVAEALKKFKQIRKTMRNDEASNA